MSTSEDRPRLASELRAQISDLESQLKLLKDQLAEAESSPVEEHRAKSESEKDRKWPLAEEEYDRYGRQLVLPTVGLQGQLRIKSASVLIIGAGGLGCPAAAYLAGAGIGTIGLVDGDTVEASNLHRQIAHATSRVGTSKVDSAITYLRSLNPLPVYKPHRTHLTPQNAEDVISGYEVVLDCTDHPTSRYLISDACVLLRKPLVSASALRTDGQLIVLNTPPGAQGDVSGGPCYRCVFPKPPPADAVLSCGEGGILGPVVGVMGVLQALQALRLISAGRHLPSAEPTAAPAPLPTLLLLSTPADGSPVGFRSVRMRGRRTDCFACGAQSALTREMLREGLMGYVAFCGGPTDMPVSLLSPDQRVTPSQYSRIREAGGRHLLLDVREKEFFEIANFPGSVNAPFTKIRSPPQQPGLPAYLPADLADDMPIYVMCRRGNDSQIIAQQLMDLGVGRGGKRLVVDITGGLQAWKAQVDPEMPYV